MLKTVGLAEMVAEDEAAYVRQAAALAGDLAGLAEMRRRMRQRVSASPLSDGRRLARSLEGAYRAAWADWCAKQA